MSRFPGRRIAPSPDLAFKSGSTGAVSFFGQRGARGSSIGADRTWRIRNPLKRNNVWRFKMKMVKSLLLGTAAGFVAIAGAQAADLPVKAKPVQYVKICSLYGAGFYYIPGTDTCLKIGGWVRQYAYGDNGNMTKVRWATVTPTTARPTTAGPGGRVATSLPMLVLRPSTALSGATSPSVAARKVGLQQQPFSATAPSSSWPASPSVCRSRSTTSTAAGCRTWRRVIRRPIPAMRVRSCGLIPRSSATACRRPCRSKRRMTQRVSNTATGTAR